MRRRPGDVRPGHDAHARTAGRVPAAQEQRPEVDQHRHRARDRLRHRPLPYKDKAAVARAAVGGRPRAVPAVRRSVAGGALHRSPERRLVPVVSRADPAADGPDRPRRAAQAGEPASSWPGARWPTASPASTPSTRSPSSRAPARPPARPRGTRAISASAPTRTSRSTRATPTWPGCSRRRATSSRAARWSSRKASSAGRRRAAASVWRRDTTTPCCRTCAGIFDAVRAPSPFDNYPGAGAARRPAGAGLSAMNIRGVFIEDTFAEAFTMRVARVVITGRTPALGARGGAQADRLRHLGHRLQVRGGDRARARAGRDARRPARRERPAA